MKLSIIIPCYNEAKTIRTIVERVRSSPYPIKEIIIVDDCSRDGTRDLLRTQIEPLVDKVIYHESNQGKGAALRTGFAAATGDAVIVQDADLEYDPNEYQFTMKPIVDGKADVVFGSRFMGGEPHRVCYFWHMIGNKFLTLVSNMMTNLNLTDMETCYKVFRRDVLQKIRIEEDHFGFEPEITAKVARLHVVIYEVGISYYGRTYAEGKKIGWRDGVRALWGILKYNLRLSPCRRGGPPRPARRPSPGPLGAPPTSARVAPPAGRGPPQPPEPVPRLGGAGPESRRRLELNPRLAGAARPGERRPQPDARVRVIRVEPHGKRVFRDRLRDAPQPVQRQGGVVVQRRRVGRRRQDAPVLLQRVPGTAHVEEREAQLPVRLKAAGIEPHRRAELLRGPGVPPLPRQGLPQRHPGPGIGRAPRHRVAPDRGLAPVVAVPQAREDPQRQGGRKEGRQAAPPEPSPGPRDNERGDRRQGKIHPVLESGR